MSAPACASQIDPHTLPSLETFELTRCGCRQADKMTVKWWKDARRDDQISQKQHSVPPRQTSHIFGNVVSCCFQMMWRSLCQELRTTAPRVSWNRPILIFVFLFLVCFFFACLFLCRDASGERYWDDIPLCHLHLHKAAAWGSSGLQRAIPEGTRIYLSFVFMTGWF